MTCSSGPTRQLVPQDNQEGMIVIYDARVAGGFAEPSSPPACTTADACRTPVLPQPSIYGAPASQTFSGAGQPRAAGSPETKPKAKPKAKPARCKKGFVKKKGKCVKESRGRRPRSPPTPTGGVSDDALKENPNSTLARGRCDRGAGSGRDTGVSPREPHPFLNMSFGRSATEPFANPNGIAVDESTGDVYVADIGTDTVYKFDANGTPLDFAALSSNALTGIATAAESFSFPSVYGTPAAIAVDNACVQHIPALTGRACEEFDPSAGDLYVMDAGHGVIDKFSPEGRYLSQIGGFPPSSTGFEGELLGLGVDGNGTVHVDLRAQRTNR